MSVGSYSQLMLALLLLICCLIGQDGVDANRHRRQANINGGVLQGNPNGLMTQNNAQFNPMNDRNNQQQSNNKFLPSSQGQGQLVRSRGFYSSPEFKPPSFSGEKPLGWFETKYQNWVTNKDGQVNKIDGKNLPPSSLQGKAMQSSRDDGGPMLLEKVAKQYASQGQKSYNMGKYEFKRGQNSVCYNRQDYGGYTFNKFYCPLPPSTGMNQMNRFCCGIAGLQYCCTEQEFYRNQAGGYDGDGVDYSNHRDSRHRHYSRTNRALAVILPIVGILVIAGAIAIVFLYYKKHPNILSKSKSNKTTTSIAVVKSDEYSAVPQEPTEQPPAVPPRQHQTTNANA